ncbi:MAG: tetratricopeptide repeat protein [Chloroflexota bacterium]
MSYDLGAYQEAMRAGHAFAWDLKWEAASRQYRTALSERPGDPSATLSLARALERMGDLDAALDMYEEAHRLLPDHAPVLVSLVELRQRLGDLPAAATCYAKLAIVYLDQGQTSRASEVLARLDDLPAPDGDVLRHLGEVARRVGNEDVLALVGRHLSALPAEDAPSAVGSAESGAQPATDSAAVAVEALPLDPLLHYPEPVKTLIAALDRRERVGRPRDDEIARLASGWCPLPAELLRIAPSERAGLAATFYDVAADVSARRLDAARDGCWGAIGIAADYLPIQVQLARVDAAAGETATAEWRLKTVAELYEAQSEFRQAAETWKELGAEILGLEAVIGRVVDLLIRQGELGEAVAVLIETASRCLVEGRVADAVDFLGRAIEVGPDAIELGLWRARLLVDLRRADEAMDWLERSLAPGQKDPSVVDRRLLVARTILATLQGHEVDLESVFDGWGDDPRDDASAVLTEAAAWGACQGGDAGSWYLAGQILAATDAVEDAERAYRRALAFGDASVATIQFALGRLAADEGDWPGAVRWLIACLDGLAPSGEFRQVDHLLRRLLQAAEHLSDPNLRVRALGELVRLHPRDPDLHARLAEARWSNGDRQGAREQLYRLADLYAGTGKPVRALAAERTAASMGAVEPASQLRLAERCLRLGFREETIAALEAVVDLEARIGAVELSPRALRMLIEQTRLTEPRRATPYRERLARVRPTDWDARRSLARAYLRDGEVRRAVIELRSLAEASATRERWVEAASALREAIPLDPWDSRLIVDAVSALIQARTGEDAAALLDALRQREPESPEIARLEGELHSLTQEDAR